MSNKKSLFTKLAAVSMVASMMLATPVMAATNDTGDKDAQNGIVKTTSSGLRCKGQRWYAVRLQ